MNSPRLEIDLDRLHHNARTLVEQLGHLGIAISGVGKAVLGLPAIARTWVEAGVDSIGDSHIETLEALTRAGFAVPKLLIRTPMLSQVDRVVAGAAISCNSEPLLLEALAAAAADQGRRHGVLLMVELGDLREGLLAADVEAVAALTLGLPSLKLMGIGANLGCQHGVKPDGTNMAELSALATALEVRFGIELAIVSGGNSANLPWLAAGGVPQRINHLRLGEALLLGREPLDRTAIPGLFTDAFTLVAEVIEAKQKPTRPWGERGLTSFKETASGPERGIRQRALLALGEQDADPSGLGPPPGIALVGASSDHLVVEGHGEHLSVGQEQRFSLNYSALLRAMTSPFVSRCLVSGGKSSTAPPAPARGHAELR